MVRIYQSTDKFPAATVYGRASRSSNVSSSWETLYRVTWGYHNISDFLFPTTIDDDFTRINNQVRSDIGALDAVIAGHSGIPFTRSVDGVSWLNSGAIGMPAHNGKPSTSYAILDVKIYDMTNDYNAAYNAMRHAGLDQGYHTAIKTGYWPSEDVLPSDLRRAADKG